MQYHNYILYCFCGYILVFLDPQVAADRPPLHPPSAYTHNQLQVPSNCAVCDVIRDGSARSHDGRRIPRYGTSRDICVAEADVAIDVQITCCATFTLSRARSLLGRAVNVRRFYSCCYTYLSSQGLKDPRAQIILCIKRPNAAISVRFIS